MIKCQLRFLSLLISTATLFSGLPLLAQESPSNMFETNTETAKCRQNFPSQSEMLKQLNNAEMEAPLISAGIGGLLLQNQNERLVRSYQILVADKAYNNGYLTIQKDLDLWDLFKDGSCKNTICAAQKVFGKEKGVLYLYVAWKYGLVMSPLGYDKIKAPSPAQEEQRKAYFTIRDWNLEELTPYLSAIAQLPKSLYPVPWTRFNMAGIVNPLNPLIYSNGTILFYTPTESLTDSQKEHTTYHEIAHAIGGATGSDWSPDWLKASGWVVNENKKFVRTRDSEFISLYSKQDYFEDFAETFTFYRFNPAKLKERSPLRYEYMKMHIYMGQEYLQECN